VFALYPLLTGLQLLMYMTYPQFCPYFFLIVYASVLDLTRATPTYSAMCSQSYLLTVSKQFLLLFTPVSFETIQLSCKAGVLLTAHLQSSP